MKKNSIKYLAVYACGRGAFPRLRSYLRSPSCSLSSSFSEQGTFKAVCWVILLTPAGGRSAAKYTKLLTSSRSQAMKVKYNQIISALLASGILFYVPDKRLYYLSDEGRKCLNLMYSDFMLWYYGKEKGPEGPDSDL